MSKTPADPNPVRDAGVGLFLAGVALLALAWVAAILAGWPAIFVVVAAWGVGIGTSRAAATIARHTP